MQKLCEFPLRNKFNGIYLIKSFNQKHNNNISQISNRSAKMLQSLKDDLKPIMIKSPNIIKNDPQKPSTNPNGIFSNHHISSLTSVPTKDTGITSSKLSQLKINCANNNDKCLSHQIINEGFIISVLKDGSIYKGIYHLGKADGYAKIYHPSNPIKTIYEGEYHKNLKSGYGIIPTIEKGQLSYEGEFFRDMKDGIGIESLNESYVYIGEFQDNQKNGIGTFTYKNGRDYSGEMKNNKFEGYGIFRYENGDLYLGEFKENVKNGYGEYIWLIGKIFFGFFINDKKNGFGVLKNGEKNYYVGFWNNDQQEGIGKTINIIDNKEKYSLWIGGRVNHHFRDLNEMDNFFSPRQKLYKNLLINLNKTQLEVKFEKILKENYTLKF